MTLVATVRAAEVYKRFGILPLCVVVTGGTPHQRAQCWWKLDEATQDSALVKTLLGSVQFALGGDPCRCRRQLAS